MSVPAAKSLSKGNQGIKAGNKVNVFLPAKTDSLHLSASDLLESMLSLYLFDLGALQYKKLWIR